MSNESNPARETASNVHRLVANLRGIAAGVDVDVAELVAAIADMIDPETALHGVLRELVEDHGNRAIAVLLANLPDYRRALLEDIADAYETFNAEDANEKVISG